MKMKDETLNSSVHFMEQEQTQLREEIKVNTSHVNKTIQM
jgi:hypothetical protein